MRPLRIVTLNTWKNEGRHAQRLDLMAAGLGALSADVICLQECFQAEGIDTAASLAAALGLHVLAEPARRKLRPHLGQMVESASGLAILCRDPLARSHRIDLPADAADGEQIGQWVEAAPGLRVLNLHLTHLRGPQASALRRAQLDQAIAGAACPGVGLLVAGDLNAAAQAPELAAIAKGLDPRAPPTLQGEHVERRSMSAAAIDHLALAQPGGWMITNRFRALDRPDAEGWFPSDHAAVAADLVRL